MCLLAPGLLARLLLAAALRCAPALWVVAWHIAFMQGAPYAEQHVEGDYTWRASAQTSGSRVCPQVPTSHSAWAVSTLLCSE